MKRWIAACAATAALAACGEGDTTTVIEEQPEVQTVTEQTTTVTEKAEAPKPEPAEATEPQGSPPDVVGLTLPTAQKLIKEAGYKPEVSNTDAAFGILVPANYTVCKQDEPIGNLVPILAQKDGC